jgi:hypothetical protein
MKTFYDKRGKSNVHEKKEFLPLQARVIWKTKTHWLIYVPVENQVNNLRGYMVVPRTVYIYEVYFATGFWDGLKALFRSGKTPAVTKSKVEFPEELL